MNDRTAEAQSFSMKINELTQAVIGPAINVQLLKQGICRKVPHFQEEISF
jgi:hypothetical protein